MSVRAVQQVTGENTLAKLDEKLNCVNQNSLAD